MGCDIHMFAEYKSKDSVNWRFLDCGNPLMDRHYDLFGLFAPYGRTEYPEDIDIVHEPNGIPDNISDPLMREYTLKIDDEGYQKGWEHTIDSDWVLKNQEYVKYYKNMPDRIIDTKWYSESCITLEEYKAILDFYKSDENPYKGNYAICWDAFYNHVKTYQDAGYDVRIIYWFDN